MSPRLCEWKWSGDFIALKIAWKMVWVEPTQCDTPVMYGGYNPRHVTMKFKPDGNLSPTHYGLNLYQNDACDPWH